MVTRNTPEVKPSIHLSGTADQYTGSVIKVTEDLTYKIRKCLSQYPFLNKNQHTVEGVAWCMAWIALHGELSKESSSYGYKHNVEAWRQQFFTGNSYTYNNSFIIAAVLSGYNLFSSMDDSRPVINPVFSKKLRMKGARWVRPELAVL